MATRIVVACRNLGRRNCSHRHILVRMSPKNDFVDSRHSRYHHNWIDEMKQKDWYLSIAVVNSRVVMLRGCQTDKGIYGGVVTLRAVKLVGLVVPCMDTGKARQCTKQKLG